MKINRKIGLLFALVAGAASLADQYVLDTGTLVCKIDPTCRKMTPGEIDFARPVFGNTIPYDDVRIFNRPMIYQLPKWFVTGEPLASVFRSNMYVTSSMGPGRYDFGFAATPSATGVSAEDDHAADFGHELAHWWQYYNRGITYRVSDMKYEYNHEFSNRFENYNEEQQAEIVGHYMQKRRAVMDFMAFSKARESQGIDATFRDKKLNQYCAELIPFETKLTPILPIQPIIGCQNS